MIFESRCERRFCELKLCNHAWRRLGVDEIECRRQPALSITEDSISTPPASDFGNELLSAQNVILFDQRPFHCGSPVPDFVAGMGIIDRVMLFAPRKTPRKLNIRQHVASRDDSFFSTCSQLFASIVAERLKQSIAWFISFEVRHNQRLANE